jgi:hypothetical protein
MAFGALAGCLTMIALANISFADSTAPTKEAKSTITHVTVYPGNALITREVVVPEGTGLMELVVNPLPPQVVDGSLYSEGNDGIRILTTRYRTRPVQTDTREEVRKLNDEKKGLQLARQDLEAKAKVNTDNLALLVKLEGFTAATMQHLTEKGLLSSEQTIALAKYIMDTRAAKSDEVTKLQQQLQANHEAVEFIDRKLTELAAGTSKTERDAIITINKANQPAGTLRLNYLVSSVSWSPQYKFRAGKDKDPILVEYLAAIRQQTGEEWNGVSMTLSTAQPMLNAAPPDLKALALVMVPTGAVAGKGIGGGGAGGKLALGNQMNMNFSQGQFGANAQTVHANPNPLIFDENNRDALSQARQSRSKAQEELNKKNYDAASLYWNEAAAREQYLQLLTSKEEEKEIAQGDMFGGASEGPTVTYKLASGLSIPSRNDEQIVEVTRLNFTPDYYYKAIPVITKHVYRLANLANKTDMVLLPGEGTMYQGTDFVGRTQLPLVAIGEKFSVGFGVDPQLQVNRKLMDKSKKPQGANQVLSYDYRILVSSYKAEAVKMQVWDRLPMAETDVVSISIPKTTPELSKDTLYDRDERSKNLLRWDVDVKPGMSGENALTISYQFKMELDKQLQVGALPGSAPAMPGQPARP